MPNSKDTLSGGVLTPNISEYVSRACRTQLVNLALQVMFEKRKAQLAFNKRMGIIPRRGGNNIGPIGLLAKSLELNRYTIRDWVENDERHPSNDNLDKIITLLIENDSDGLLQLLEEDLFTHSYALGLLSSRASNYVYPNSVWGGIYTKQKVIA